jgi:hypothetical protein
MERMTILIRVKDRWLDNDEYDEYGELIRWANPNPTVVWHSGCWSREEGEGVMIAMTAHKFRELTGHIIYGGDIEKRGIHKLSIMHGDYGRLQRYRQHGITERGGPKKTARVLPKRDKLKELREGRGQQLEGVRCRVRKRT